MKRRERKAGITSKMSFLGAMFLVVFLAMTTTGMCSQVVNSGAALPASVDWDRGPEALLLSYRDIWGEFANQDSVPLIRIFGDGRVLIHYPAYTPRAGEYELHLPARELEDLLLSLLAKGLTTFEPLAVKRSKELEELTVQEAVLDAGEIPELFMVADDSTSVFELHLQDYQAAGSALASGEVNRTISWRGLGTDARRYPQLDSIQQLRNAELELKALLERDDLRRIR